MNKYIVLLRGINVGGKNKVSMKDLKELFENNGFLKVITYINSGNIIFSTENDDTETLKKHCETLILERFGLQLSVLAISANDISEALDNAPEWWDVGQESKHNAIFVIPPATVQEVFEAVGEAKPEYERVGHYGKIIFWSAPLNTFSKTRWSKVVGTSVYDSITIRNSNTVKKLMELCMKD